MNDLAIVIPAYKAMFFDKTLASLARQTDKRFNVYIGDDFSPFDLPRIIKKYEDKLTIYYERFPNNIGAKNLVFQWKRCVELTKQEKWLCLFSDDDIMDERCVENFYETVKKKEDAFDVYRFNTVTINKDDEVIIQSVAGPEIESAEQMAFHLLNGQRGNSMPDHIFSRNVYNKCGGFVFTEYAQGADWASSILFAQDKGICIIPDAKVHWRYSGTNISSTASGNSFMIKGHLQFLEWALKHFAYLSDGLSSISYAMMRDALRMNLKIVLINHYKGFQLSNTPLLVNFYRKQLKLSYYEALKELIAIKRFPLQPVGKLRRLASRIKNYFFFKKS